MVPTPGWTEDSRTFHQATRNAHSEKPELSISAAFHLMFSDRRGRQVAEIRGLLCTACCWVRASRTLPPRDAPPACRPLALNVRVYTRALHGLPCKTTNFFGEIV